MYTNTSNNTVEINKIGSKGNYDMFVYNKDRSFVICYNSKIDTRNPNEVLHFCVYDIINNIIVYEDLIANLSVSWFNKRIIKFTKQKAYIVSPNDSAKYSYYYDVILKKKLDLKDSNLK